MTGPSGFTRPEAWRRLDAQHDTGPPGTPAPPRGKRRRRSNRSGRHGLGRSATGPDFSWPTVPAAPATDTSRPPTRTSVPDPAMRLDQLPARQRRRKRMNRPTRPQRFVPSGRNRWIAGSLSLLVILALFVVAAISSSTSGQRRPGPRPTTPSLPALPITWTTSVEDLRTDLPQAELLMAMDGSFDDARVIEAGKVWLVMSSDTNDQRIELHGIDSTTGRPLWNRSLADGLCASETVRGSVFCAASIATDPVTGLGTRWRLALLDPITGEERRGVDWDGWLTLVHVDGERIMLVEQRMPAPHAVLTGLNAKLAKTWAIDLSDQAQHEGLFSDNRIYQRKLPIPKGPALDRPRLRKIADGLTALWSGRTTAFIDPARGRLVGMPRCSRLVDDGERLWCNQGGVAAALSYQLKPLYQTALNTRLAFPNPDRRFGDVSDPIFLESDGKAVRVDLTNGKTVGALVDTRNGSVWRVVTSPQTSYTKGLTLISDSTRSFAVNARTGDLLWQRDDLRRTGDALDWNGKLLLLDSDVWLLNRETGDTQSSYRQSYGLYTQLLGEVLIGIGPEGIARLANP